MSNLRDILYFVILLGVLIFVHELGHFLWAKIFHVKVLKFSLGFGPKVVGFRRGDTEYVLSAVAVGGYVKMLGDSTDDEERTPADAGRAFTDKPLWQRAIILVGGPAMNLILPILIYFAVGLLQDEVSPASVGTVFAGMPAAEAGLRPGDVVVSIDGEETPAFDDVVSIVSDHPEAPLRFRVRRDIGEFDRTITPVRREDVIPILGTVEEVGRIGILPTYRTAIVGPPGPAGAAAGIRAFDEFVAVNGRRVRRLIDLERIGLPDGTASVGILRGAPVATGLGTVFVAAPETLALSGAPGRSLADTFGITTSDLVVSGIRPGGAAEAGGLRVGDRLLRLDGKPLLTWYDVQLVPGRDREEPHAITVLRDGVETELAVTPRLETFVDPLGQEHPRFSLGAGGYLRSVSDEPIANPNRISRAFFGSFAEAWNVIRLTGYGIAAIFQGRVSVKTIGGPLLIFDVAAQSAEAGAVPFLWAMALISINLGLLNLLPIPVLDGGHLLFFGIEAVRRKPVGRRTREIAQTVGLVLILALVALAMRNDIARWLGMHGCG